MAADFTSELAAELAPDLLARFERYVRIDTQSDRDADPSRSPSTDTQLDLSRQLVSELEAAGLQEVTLDDLSGHICNEGFLLHLYK